MKKLPFGTALVALIAAPATAQTASAPCGDVCHNDILNRASSAATQAGLSVVSTNIAQLQASVTDLQKSVGEVKSQIGNAVTPITVFTMTGSNLGQCNSGPQEIALVNIAGCFERNQDLLCPKFNIGNSRFQTIAIARDGLIVKAFTCQKIS